MIYKTRIRLFSLLTFVLLLPSLIVGAQDVAKAKIGIMNFKVTEGIDPSLGAFLEDVLLENVITVEDCTVIEGEKIQQAFNDGRQLKSSFSDN